MHGNEACKAIRVPAHAFLNIAPYGRGWECERGFRPVGELCEFEAVTLVRLCRDAAEPQGRDLFACPLAQWHFLLELERTFGWAADGATYELRAHSKIVAAVKRDYEPGDPSDRKLVDAEDARRLAHALEDALTSKLLPAMIEARAAALLVNENTVTSIMDSAAEFVQYAYGGAFTFSLDDG